jgi:hypothetical protein
VKLIFVRYPSPAPSGHPLPLGEGFARNISLKPSSQNQKVAIHPIEDGNSRQMPPLLEPKLSAQCQTRPIVCEHERKIRREPQICCPLDGALHQPCRNAGALRVGVDINADFGGGGVGRPSVEWLETQPSLDPFIRARILENPDRVSREIAILKPGLA